MGSTAYFIFGRLQPPHRGHAGLINYLYNHAKSNRADAYVFPSSSHDSRTNPLSIEQKVKWLNIMFPAASYPGLNIINTTEAKTTTIPKVVAYLLAAGYTKISILAGADRVPGFEKIFKDGSVGVIGIPRPEGSISGTKVRSFALANNFESFYESVKIGHMTRELAHEMMDELLIGLIPSSTASASASKSSSAAAGAGGPNNMDGGRRYRTTRRQIRKKRRTSRCRA